jgi:polyisoprenoid-binding protein YceI
MLLSLLPAANFAGNALKENFMKAISLRRLVLAAAVLAIALPLSAHAQTSTWTIDSYHSSVAFAIRHAGVSTVNGNFYNVTGSVDWNDADVSKSSVNATIDTTTVSTGVAPRDNHIKSPDFLDVAKFPTITFKSTSVAKTGDGLTVTGDLTLHGVTKSVTLNVTDISAPQTMGPAGKQKTARGLTASATINRHDFGVMGGMADSIVGNDLKITIELELDKK